MNALYDLLYFIFCLIYVPVLIFSGKWHRGLFTRFGHFSQTAITRLGHKRNIWFHAVSVGEVQAIAGLIGRFSESFARYQPVLTTVTRTGYHLAEKNFGPDVLVLFAPVDFSWVVRKFVRLIAPVMYITAETEVWPNLFRALSKRKIPVMLVNGRISDKSFSRYRKTGWIFKDIFGMFACCCVQSSRDADRLELLGVPLQRITVVGNMKFDEVKGSPDVFKSPVALSMNQKIWIAGSTHPKEEDVVLDIYKSLRDEFKDLRLAIAPRHIERVKVIQRLVKNYKLNPILYSENPDRVLRKDDVMIVDTIGHLRALYRCASVVFVGKSLMGRGGQNIIEPAFYAKPVIVGPHMENFKKIVEIFLEVNAIVQIKNKAELKKALQEILRSPARANAMGLAAYNVILQQQGATAKTLRRIANSLPVDSI